MGYTGYRVTQYIDDNPLSPTYGNTWTERELDTSHCPTGDDEWVLVSTSCEATTSGFTGNMIYTYYNSATNEYSSTTVSSSECDADSLNEIWVDSGETYCEQDEDGIYSGWAIQVQVQRNSNLLNYNETREVRIPDATCEEHLEPNWTTIYSHCTIVADPVTGQLSYDGTLEELQIDDNPSSPTYNQTRVIYTPDEENCPAIICDEVERTWEFVDDICGSVMPVEYGLTGLTPDTVYHVYREYESCIVGGVPVKTEPTNRFSATTYQTGVSDCLERWVETDETVCQYTNVYSGNYLTFVALENGTFGYIGNSNYSSIEYSLDSGATWQTLASGSSTPTVSAGDKVYWRDTKKDLGNNGRRFSSTGRFDVEGNVMSLLYGDNFAGQTDISGNPLYSLFYNCTKLVSAENLILPATTLTNYCYEYMFSGCRSLTTAPELPATTLASQCYNLMFSGCTSLTTAPALPAETLAVSCYNTMFAGCTSLTTAPELPATTLPNYCYQYMYSGCTSLTSVPSFPNNLIMGNWCCDEMFRECTSLVTAPEINALTVGDDSCYDMFVLCTSLKTAPPMLTATTFGEECFMDMFYGCTGLTTAPSVISAATLGSGCCMRMFQGCTSLTTAPELPSTSVEDNCYDEMFYGCTSLTTAPSVLPANVLKEQCYSYMFAGCTSLTTAPVLSATSLATRCCYGMFRGCASLTTAPIIPNTTNADINDIYQSYQYMFSGCTSLNYINAKFVDWPNYQTTTGWVIGVSGTGTFVTNSNITYNPESKRGTNGIPTNWQITSNS